MKVVHLPCFASNPYQEQLFEGLRGRGVKVIARGHITWSVLYRALFEWKCDVIHFHWLHTYAGRPSFLHFIVRYIPFAIQLPLLRLFGRRIVWTVHNLQGHEKDNRVKDRMLSFLLAWTANRLIVHDESAREAVARFFHVSAKKVAVVPHGNYIGYYPNEISREDARNKLGLKKEDFVFLFLGAVRPYKGVTDLIEVLTDHPGMNCRLLIAGRTFDEGYHAEVEAAAERDPRIQLHLGFVEEEDIQVYMNACDVVVFPYKDILTSGAVLLAMSFGKACLAPRVGGIATVLDDEGGFLYDKTESKGLSSALERAVGERAKLSEMGEENYRKSQQWNWDEIARLTIDAYTK